MSQFGFNPGFNQAHLIQPGAPRPQTPQAPAPAQGGSPSPQPGQPGGMPIFNFTFGSSPQDFLRYISQQYGQSPSSPAPQGQPQQGGPQGGGIGGGIMPLGGSFQSSYQGALPTTPQVVQQQPQGFTPAGQAGGNGLMQTAQGPMTIQEAQRRGITGPFSTGNLLQAFQQDIQGQQNAFNEQQGRQRGVEEGFRSFMQGIPQQMQQGLERTIRPLNQFATQLEQTGQQQFDVLNQHAQRLGQVAAPDFSLVRRDLDASNRAAGAAVSSAMQARNQYGDQSAQRASAIATSMQTMVQDQMRMISAGINPDGSMMTPQQQQQAQAQLQSQVQTQTSQALAQYLDESERYRTSLTQSIGAAQQGQAAQLSQNASVWANAMIAGTQQQREAGRDAAQVASAAIQAQQRMVEAAGQIRGLVAQYENAAVINATNLMLQGWQTYSQMINEHPTGYASIMSGILALAQVDAARSSPTPFSLGIRDDSDGGGLSGNWVGGSGGFQSGFRGSRQSPGSGLEGNVRAPRAAGDYNDPTRVSGRPDQRMT